MVKILSFDVGIKNLAYCLVNFNEEGFEIEDWDVIDITENLLDKNLKCSVVSRGKLCNKLAINYAVTTEKNIGFCDNKRCQSIASSTYSPKNLKKAKILKLKDIELIDLTGEMIKKLRLKQHLLDVDIVVIENQPVLKNPTMKSIQMVLYSYFLIYGITTDKSVGKIALFNAGKKLDVYTGPKIELNCKANSYTERKKLSIEYTKCIIKDKTDKLTFFNEHKKKDDLADALLQCLTYYKKKHNA